MNIETRTEKVNETNNCVVITEKTESNSIPNSIVKEKLALVMNNLKPKRKFIAIISAACVVIISVIAAIISLTGSVSAADYINFDAVEINGYDGYATARANDILDYSLLIENLGSHKYKDNILTDEVFLFGEEGLLKNCVDIKFDKNSNIKNGDDITISVSINYDRINSYNFDKKLKGKKEYTKKISISNLKKVASIDPFEIVKSVIDDNGHYRIIYNTEYKKNLGEYTLSYGEGFREGLQITNSNDEDISTIKFSISNTQNDKITLKTSCEETSYADYGIIVTEIEKPFTPLACELLKDGKKIKSEDLITLEEIAKTYVEGSYENLKLEKILFEYADDSFFGETNLLTFIYSFDYKDMWTGEVSKQYIPVDYGFIKIDSNNNVVNIDSSNFDTRVYQDSIEYFENSYREDGYKLTELTLKK